jgi:hypothetical protein
MHKLISYNIKWSWTFYVWMWRASHHPFLKVLWRFESIVKLAREIIRQHDIREPRRHHEWPTFTMTIKELGRDLPLPSVVFHTITSMSNPWVAWTLSHYTSFKRGKVSSNSAIVETTKFAGAHKSHMRQYIIKSLFIWAQPMRALIDSGGGYHLRSSEFTVQTTLNLPI